MNVAAQFERFERIARSRLLGIVLVLASAWFVADVWRATDWSALDDAHLGWLMGAGATYSVSFACIAFATGGPIGDSLRSVSKAQILKYIPGTVWQGRPFLRQEGINRAVQYTLAVLAAGLAAITLGVQGWLRWATAAVLLIGAAGFAFKGGAPRALRLLGGAVATAVAVGMSAMFAGLAFGFDPLRAAMAIGASWGFGVVAVPVPSGIGVREATSTALLGAQGAPIIVAHRVVTLVVDSIAGLAAFSARQGRKRPSS